MNSPSIVLYAKGKPHTPAALQFRSLSCILMGDIDAPLGDTVKTISVRDLRSKSAQIWRELQREKDMVVTSKGRPVGVLSYASEANLERTLTSMRRARSMLGLLEMQVRSVKAGHDRLSLREINAEIGAVRRKRAQ